MTTHAVETLCIAYDHKEEGFENASFAFEICLDTTPFATVNA
jgi:hypothetical protein